MALQEKPFSHILEAESAPGKRMEPCQRKGASAEATAREEEEEAEGERGGEEEAMLLLLEATDEAVGGAERSDRVEARVREEETATACRFVCAGDAAAAVGAFSSAENGSKAALPCAVGGAAFKSRSEEGNAPAAERGGEGDSESVR